MCRRRRRQQICPFWVDARARLVRIAASGPTVCSCQRRCFDLYRNDMTAKLDRHAAQLAALGSPVRLAILRLLVQGDPEGTVVGDLQKRLEMPWSTLSHHLDRLTSAGLLVARPEGKFIYYRPDFAALRGLTDYLWEDCCKSGSGSCC
jgi:DNA-binding transcriptional ArsR family regulator